jgi:putative ABC transport system permease protein
MIAALRDVSHAVRRLRREPRFAMVTVLILAAGIGACTAMFSIIHAVLLRPMAVPAADRVVMLWSIDVRHDVVLESTYETQADFKARLRSFEEVALMGSVNWGGSLVIPGRDPVHLSAAAVSGTFFEVLGSRALLGRVFDARDDDPRAERRLVLSYAAWRQFFGADPSIVGRKVMMREEAVPQAFEVIGVMPPEFFFPRGTEYWTPAAPRLEAIARHTRQPRADLFGKLGVFYALGRLKPGVSVDEARREMPLYLKAVGDQFRIDVTNFRIVVTPLVDFIFGPARQTLWLLMAAVALVLLIACGNVAGLVFARGASRRREIAVRAALGASRGVLVRQLLAESAFIAGAGGLLGVLAAAALLEALVALSPADIPRLDDTGINLPVVFFALATALVATVLVGLVPALRASRTSLVDDMKNGTMGAGQARAPGRGLLVAVQVAGTLVLLIATGLCIRSFAKLSDLDLGFNPAQVLTFSVNGLNEEQFPSRAARHDLVDRLLAGVEQLPQVRSAGAVYERPFEHGPIGMDSGVLLEGQPDTPDEINRNGVLNWESVTSRYFESMNIRLLRGRIFDERDSAGADLSAIVSEAAANRLWPGQDPIGKQLRLSLTEDDRWHTVVGVVATARYREIANPRSDLYVPMRQSTIDVKHFTVRTTGDPLSATAAVDAAIKNVDPRLSIGEVTTMDAVVRRVRGPWHFTLIVFALFGFIAVALAVTGLFAVVSYAVTRRSREIGVRMALGATPGRVVRLMLVEGAGPAAVGLLAGAAASRALSRAVQPLLFDLSASDFRTFTAVVLFFGLVIMMASYLPARRAGRIDPQSALRHE